MERRNKFWDNYRRKANKGKRLGRRRKETAMKFIGIQKIDLAFAFAALCAVPCFAATVVHDAARDLVLNSRSANVYTNIYGGVWSYMRSSSYDGARTLLPSVRSRTDTETDSGGRAIVWQRGPARSSSASPVICVNPTVWPDAKTFIRGSDWPTIPSGGLSCHPGNTTDEGSQCVVLRFTTPRDGRYAVTAKAWNRNVGKTAVTLLVNGAVRRDRIAWTSSASAVTTNDFSLAYATYSAGDTIELAVDGDGTFSSNATGLDFCITEEVGEVHDAASGFLGNIVSGTPTNPYTDSFGTWTGYYTDSAGTPTNGVRKLFGNKSYVRRDQGNAMAGMSMNSSKTVPYMVVNRLDAMAVETNSVGKATTIQGMGFWPGEIMTLMSYTPFTLTVLQVKPNEGGIYDVGLSIRDMYLGTAEATKGVNVWLLQGGVVLAKTYVSAEAGVPCASLFVKGLTVLPQIPIAVAIDDNGNNGNDGTGISWAFVKTGTRSPAYDANAAMKANMKSAEPTNPFTYGGATWQAGRCLGGWKGNFISYGVQQVKYNSTTKGWGENDSTSPFVAVNISGGTVSASILNVTCDAGVDMLFGHPRSDNSATALRFTAPADGVYSATAWFADLRADSDSGAGVDVHLLVQEHHADSDLVRLSANPTGEEAKRLEAERLFLRAGEAVTFAIGANGNYSSDLTGFYAWLDSDGDASASQWINIDINSRDAAGPQYAGAGRIGYADDRWNGLAVKDGAARYESLQLYAASGVRTGVTLSMAKEDSVLTVSAANGATDTSASSLFSDGLVSTNSSDVNVFTLSGLLPGARYELYFFSRSLTSTPPATAQSVVHGVFTVGSDTAMSGSSWFADEFGDYARIFAVSDAEGKITGTFRSASDDASAFWCGMQVLGSGFGQYTPLGMTISFK